MGGRGSASSISGNPVTRGGARKRRMKNFDAWFNAGR